MAEAAGDAVRGLAGWTQAEECNGRGGGLQEEVSGEGTPVAT